MDKFFGIYSGVLAEPNKLIGVGLAILVLLVNYIKLLDL